MKHLIIAILAISVCTLAIGAESLNNIFAENPELAFNSQEEKKEWAERNYLFVPSDLELNDSAVGYKGEFLYYVLVGPEDETAKYFKVLNIDRVSPSELNTEVEIKVEESISESLKDGAYSAESVFVAKVSVSAEVLNADKYNKALRKLFDSSPSSALVAQPSSVRTENTGFPEYEISREAKDAGFKSVFLPLAVLIKPDGTVARVDYKGQGQGKWEEPEKTVVEGFFRAVEKELTFEPSPDKRWWVLSMCITLRAEEK